MTESKEFNKSNQSDDSTEDSCCICLGEIENMSNTDVCLHRFCFSCIVRWSQEQSCCPMCRRQFTEIKYDIKEGGTYSSRKVVALTGEESYDDGDESDSDDDDDDDDGDDGDMDNMFSNIVDVIMNHPAWENISQAPMVDVDDDEVNENENDPPSLDRTEVNRGTELSSADDGPEMNGDDLTDVSSQASSSSPESHGCSLGVPNGSGNRPIRSRDDESDDDSEEYKLPPLKRTKY